MKRWITYILLSVATMATICSCGKDEPYEGRFDHVIIFVGSAYNNLSSSVRSDLIAELCSGEIPQKKDRNALVAFMHNTTGDAADYKTPVSPCLARIYKDRRKIILDTLSVFDSKLADPDPKTLGMALNMILSKYPSDHYGMIYSSHGTGWLPPQYYGKTQAAPYPEESPRQNAASLASVGSQFDVTPKYTYELDIRDMARCIPMHLDYLIFDACLMGGIEVAYEMRKCCDYIIASPTEIYKEGLYYKDMASRLLRDHPDLVSICNDYIEHCVEGTIALYDCSRLDDLATVSHDIIASHRSGIIKVNTSNIQKYYTGNHYWFFDLRDILLEIGADQTEMAKLDNALDKAVLVSRFTNTFLGITISNSCGLSMFLPIPIYSTDTLLEYYRTLAWNKATLLVE